MEVWTQFKKQMDPVNWILLVGILFVVFAGPVISVMMENRAPGIEPVVLGPIYRDGAQCYDLPGQTRRAVTSAFGIYAEIGFRLEVTSCRDDAHGRVPDSLHEKGLAIDLGIKGMERSTVLTVASFLQLVLGADYDVVPEADHIHVEFDPEG